MNIKWVEKARAGTCHTPNEEAMRQFWNGNNSHSKKEGGKDGGSVAYRGEGGGVRRPHVLAGVVGEPKQQAGQEELRPAGLQGFDQGERYQQQGGQDDHE
eukprot:EG_transcript_34874